VVDYTQEDFTKNNKQYDLILAVNGYHSLWAYRRALKPQGVCVFAGGDLPQILQSLLFAKWLSQKGGKTLRNMGITKINQDDVAQLGELLQAGSLAPVIDRRYPLSKTVDAIRYVIENHAQGKIVIEVFKD
jgi:NADPH:quinone reductase-like Zn-dependent oxidoreductase